MYKTKEENIINTFYHNYLIGSVFKTMMWLLSGIVAFLEFIYIALPFSEMVTSMKDDGELMLLLLIECSIWSAWLYLRPYQVYKVQDKTYSFEEQFKYLPIQKSDLYKVHVKKVVAFLTKILLIAMLVQTLTSVLANTFSIWCILYVFVITFAIPLIFVFLWKQFLIGICLLNIVFLFLQFIH